MKDKTQLETYKILINQRTQCPKHAVLLTKYIAFHRQKIRLQGKSQVAQ